MKKDIQSKKEASLTKIIIKTSLKTLWSILFCLGFLILSATVVAPKFVLKAYDSVGLDKAGYLVQKRLYIRDNSNENLYNLIQRSIETEEYADQAKFISIMLELDDYSQFSEKVDLATKEILGAKYSIYADSYDSYLRRHLVTALYKTSNELEAKMLAIDSVYGSLGELHQYVNLVVQDEELSEFQKKTEIKTLYSRYSILSAIETKMLELDELLVMSSSNYDAIIIYDQKIQMAEIQFLIGKYADDDTLEDSAKTNMETWIKNIETLKKEIK